MTYEIGKVYTNNQGTGFIVMDIDNELRIYRITPEVTITKTPIREGRTFHEDPRTTIERHLEMRGISLDGKDD